MQDFDNAVVPYTPPPEQASSEKAEPFIPESDADYDGETITTTYTVAGERNHVDDRSPEDIERDREAGNEALRRLQAEDADDARAARSKKPDPSAQQGEMQRTALGNWMQRRLGVHDKGDYLTARGDPKTKDISLKQAKAAILTGVLEKGWDTIYCYKGNNIDPKTRQTVMAALQELQQPGQPLHGRDINVPEKRMRELEPWRIGREGTSQKNPIGWVNRFERAASNMMDDVGTKASLSMKSGLSRAGMAMNFKSRDAGGGPGGA